MTKKTKYKTILLSAAMALMLTGCTKSYMVSHNVSKEADNFNVTRRITVINVRDDTVLCELTGNFSLQNSNDNELIVISELKDGQYKKDFIYLSDWTTYIVQDVSGADVGPYHYEVSILPKSAVGTPVNVTTD